MAQSFSVSPVNMHPLTAYRVTKDCTDGTLQRSDIVWLSENGDLNIAHPRTPGWLSYNEWHDPKTMDFYVEVAEDYEVLLLGRKERLQKRTASDAV